MSAGQRLLSDYGHLYVVTWPGDPRPFTKVGISYSRRWEKFSSGHRLVLVLDVPDDDIRRLELLCHVILSHEANPRFGNRNEASRYLGGHGAGFTECYSAPGEYVAERVSSLVQRYYPEIELLSA